jgi:hypothetical protein
LQLQALFDPAPAEINPALAEKRFRQIAEVDIEWTSTSTRELENKVRYKDKNGSGFRYHISTTKDQISYRFVYPLERTPQ